MTLSWNMIARSISVGSLMLEHFDWKDDCLNIKVAKSKSDQTGEGLSNIKHVFANPENPAVCPILSLAVYIWCTQQNPRVASKLYIGKNSESLKDIIAIVPDVDALGAELEDIGTHSNRKGSGTYVLSLHNVSAVQVYLRAGDNKWIVSLVHHHLSDS